MGVVGHRLGHVTGGRVTVGVVGHRLGHVTGGRVTVGVVGHGLGHDIQAGGSLWAWWDIDWGM